MAPRAAKTSAPISTEKRTLKTKSSKPPTGRTKTATALATPSTADSVPSQDVETVANDGSPRKGSKRTLKETGPPSEGAAVKLDLTSKSKSGGKSAAPSTSKGTGGGSKKKSAKATDSASVESAEESGIKKTKKQEAAEMLAAAVQEVQDKKTKRRRIDEPSADVASSVDSAADSSTSSVCHDEDVQAAGPEEKEEKIPDLMSLKFAVHNEENMTNDLASWMSHWNVRGVVFVVFPKANTPGCTKQCVAFQNLEIPSHIKVVGVSPDKLAAQKAFALKHELKFPLVENGLDLARLLNSVSDDKIVRSVVYLDGNGRMLYEKHKVQPEPSCADFEAFLKTTLDNQGVEDNATSVDEDAPPVEKKRRARKAETTAAPPAPTKSKTKTKPAKK